MKDNIKVTFDDLIKRKCEKDKSIKKQIEANKKNLLERFFNKANTHSPTSTAPNSTMPSNSNNFDSNNPNEKETILTTIYEYSITETSKFEYDESRNAINDTNAQNNMNYMQMREKYKNERNKKKSSIFKSEDLRISQTESLNLKQSDTNSNAHIHDDNVYSPINENNILQNQDNIFLIQKKLFENENNAYIESQDIFDMNNICIKDEYTDNNNNNNNNTSYENVNINTNACSDYVIQKQFDFCLYGIVKKRVTHFNVASAGNINRNKRILSMQLAAKIDYSVHTKQSSCNKNCSNANSNRNKSNSNMVNITKKYQQHMTHVIQQRTRSTSKQQRKQSGNVVNSPSSLSGKTSLIGSFGIGGGNAKMRKKSGYKVLQNKNLNSLIGNNINKPKVKFMKPTVSLNKKKTKCSF